MPIQPLTSIETEHTRFLYESAYTPISQQPYLLSTPFMEGDSYPLGSVFFLVFDSPSADVQAEFATGVRRTLTFRMAGGAAVTAPVSCVSFLSGQTLYVAFTLLATIFLLPTPHLQQGASSMVFLPRDGSDAPVDSVFANNGVGQVPLAGGTPITTSDNKVTAPAMVQVTNFPSGGSGGGVVTAVDGGIASVGNTADTAYVSGAGTMIALLKAIFLKVAGTLGVSVTNWPSSQAVTGSVSVSNLPTTQATSGADGSQATIGTTTDTTSANTLVGLLKSIKSALLGTIGISGSVSVSNLPSTQATSVADGSSVTMGAKADTAYADTSGAASGSFIALLKGLFVKVSGHALETGGNLTQIASNTANVANESGGHLASMDVSIGTQSDTPAASSGVTGSVISFLKAILAAVISPVAPSYEYNSGVTGTVDRVRNAQGKGYATAAIGSGGATVGQPVITLASSAPATLQVGMQIQLIGGTEEPADIISISGTAVTLSSNIVNASHTSIGWDTFAVNGPLSNPFSAIGVSLRGLTLFNPNGSVATPYQQAQSDGNGALKMASSDGAQVTQGAKADATTNDTTSAWSMISLLKGIYARVAGTLTTSVSNFPATQATTVIDGGNVTIGTTTDASSALTLVGLLKAIKAAITSAMSFIQPDVTTSGNITAAQPSIGTTVANASVTLAVGNGQSSWRAQLTGLTATDVIFVDHSTDNGTTWNSSNFMVGGAANNTPVSSVTALSTPTELSGNDAGVSHIKIRCGTYNSGDTIGVYIRAGFGIGRLGIISPIPAGTNSIGSVNVGTLPSLPAGTNQIGHVVLDSGTVSGIEYQWNGGAPNNQNYDRLRTVQALTPTTATIASGNSAASTAPVLSSATGLQPGQWVLLSNSTPATDSTAEWVLTTSSYVAGTTTLALTSGIVTAGHTNAYWNAYTVFGPQASFFYWEGLGAQGLALNNGAQAVLAQGDKFGNLKTSGGFLELTGLTAGSSNADLIPSTDVSSFKWWSIQITGTWVGTLTVQGSNDNSTWNAVLYQNSNAGPTSGTTIASGSTGIFYGACMFRYLRIRMTSYTSGTANAVAELYSTPAPLIIVGATQNGTYTVQPGNTPNTTPWLVNSADGGQATIGAKADSTTNDTTSAWSVVSLLKGIYAKIAGTVAVSGTFWQTTQPVSSADGGQITQGAKADSAATDSTSSWSMVALLKGIVAQLLKMTFDGSGNLKVTGGTGGGGGPVTAASASFVDGSIVTMGTEGDSAATSGTGGSWTLAALLRGILNGIQATLTTKGGYTEAVMSAVSTLNADLLASTDVSAYKWVSVQLVAGTSPAWQGTVSFQGSNDNSNWSNALLGRVDASNINPTQSTFVGSLIMSGPVPFRYLRIRLTTATQGSISGTAELYTSPPQPLGITTNSSQNGVYTVQPGNTPNTAPWLASIHDGTNKANVFANSQANQNAALVAGAFYEQTGLSAASLNADLVPSTDVSAFKWWSVQVTALATGGALSFQGSNDNSNWQSVESYITSSSAVFSTGAQQTGIFYGACNFRYFRVRQTGWTSGATTGVAEFYTNTGAFTSSQSLGASNSTIGGVFTKLGTVNVAIAAGLTSNTIVKASNGNLGRILITSLSGSTQVQVNIYDNSTTNAGTIIGIVKATVVVGDIVDVQMVANAGITIAGAAGNPGMTVLYS